MSDLPTTLKPLRKQGILHDIDLELCRFLQDQHESLSDKVLLSACLVSYLYRQGDVCLKLDKYASQPLFEDSGDSLFITAPDLSTWLKVLKESPIVGSPGNFKPLILDGNRLYLHKFWHYENALAEQLIERSEQKVSDIDLDALEDGLARTFPVADDSEVDWQRVSAGVSVRNKLSIISGGPGTGKTSTVVRILALMLEQSTRDLDIALAAPTGKAAARLKDSIMSAKENLSVNDEIRQKIPEQTKTLHQLLGARRHSSSFKHDRENPVPYDVVIVDEASMIDQALMSKLLDALLRDARLILLGDKDQLASVEAGSVLGDICRIDRNQFSGNTASWLKKLSLRVPKDSIVENPMPLIDNITLLTKSYRFDEDSGIARLADNVNEGNSVESIEILDSSVFRDVSLTSISDRADLDELLQQKVTDYFKAITNSDSIKEALSIFNEFRILSAHRRGPWGVEYLNQYIEQLLRQEGLVSKFDQWYAGKPVIVNVNDYTLGLYNGDTGVCLPDENGDLKIHFPQEDNIRAIAPGRLPDYSTAFALTVHKSQGSEFDQVLIILPDKPSKVLTRELIYTAITRARTEITVLGSKSVLKQGIEKKLERSSGLGERIWKR